VVFEGKATMGVIVTYVGVALTDVGTGSIPPEVRGYVTKTVVEEEEEDGER